MKVLHTATYSWKDRKATFTSLAMKGSAYKIELVAQCGDHYEELACLKLLKSEFSIYSIYNRFKG